MLLPVTKLQSEAPVAAFWPEFAQNGKEHVLVRHVLTHSAGLQKMRARTKSLDEIYDFEHQVRAAADVRRRAIQGWFFPRRGKSTSRKRCGP